MRIGIVDARIEDPDVVLSCDERHEAREENKHHPPKNCRSRCNGKLR